MEDYSRAVQDGIRFLFIGLFIIACIFLLSFFISTVSSGSAQADDGSNSGYFGLSDSPNVIAEGMTQAIENINQSSKETISNISNSLTTFGSTSLTSINNVGRMSKNAAITGVRGVANASIFAVHTTVRGLMYVGRGIGKGTLFIGSSALKCIIFVIKIPASTISLISNTGFVSKIIKPSAYVQVPIIDPNSPELMEAIYALPPSNEGAQKITPATTPAAKETSTIQTSVTPKWPIHGNITTRFGEPHYPYQPIHTGIDISDGNRSGITPIYPFRPGKVVDVIHIKYSLGNHVVVDHGNGVTSVYGHLNSTSVQIGQEVSMSTVLGYEGTTGASTGPHLHFEIRVNGRATDPHNFITGQP